MPSYSFEMISVIDKSSDLTLQSHLEISKKTRSTPLDLWKAVIEMTRGLLRWETALVVVITLSAFSLRFYQLGEWSFWIDEIITLRAVQGEFPRWGISLGLTRPVVEWFGVHEWTLRFIPALVGSLTVPVLYFPIRRLLGLRVGVLSAVLLALSPWHLYFSQNARYYTTLTFLCSLSLFLFYFGYRSGKPGWFVGALILTAMAVYERTYGIFVIPIVLAFVLVSILTSSERVGNTRLSVLKGFAVVSLGFGLILIASVVISGRDSFALTYLNTFLEKFAGLQNMQPHWLLKDFSYRVGVPIHGMALVGAFLMLKRQRQMGLFFATSAWTPLLMIMALSLGFRTFTRYAAITMPFLMVLAAYGAIGLRDVLRKTPWAIWLTGLLLGALLTQDPLMDDLRHHMIQKGETLPLAIFPPLVALGVYLSTLSGTDTPITSADPNREAGSVPLNLSEGAGEGGFAERATRWVWSLAIFTPLLLHPFVADFTYFFHQHGYRDNWKLVAQRIQEEYRKGDLVLSSVGKVGSYYLPPDFDVSFVESVDLASAIRDPHTRLWIVYDYGMTELLPSEAQGQIMKDCVRVGTWDNYAAGKEWMMRLYRCEGSRSGFLDGRHL